MSTAASISALTMLDVISRIDQQITTFSTFTLESGRVLRHVPVAYKTWGRLNEMKDNVMIICHALTGSADVKDWWGPLIGPGKAFDTNRFFIFCANALGSPYGSASPVTINPDTTSPYGPEFPATTIRDDVRIHKMVLDRLGVSSVAVVIGGSMGGMTTLEWPLCTQPGYVRHIVPIATSARHSAWCISWGEAQRQSIYADPTYQDGYYPIEEQPRTGLAAARMAALLTYRSRDSFEHRFGRRPQIPMTPPDSPSSLAQVAFAAHNDGLRGAKPRLPQESSSEPSTSSGAPPQPPVFSAQSYLRYQGDKFTARFDANCYIHITRKMDTHDVTRGRSSEVASDEASALARVLALVPPRALVIGIKTDGLFTPSEQHELARCIPEAELAMIQSSDGHDGFLLEFEQMNRHILCFLKKVFPDYYTSDEVEDVVQDFTVSQTSMFGEAEVDITRW